MLINKNSVVEFHYTLRDAEKQLENSYDGKPLIYLHGFKGLFETLENALVGKTVGDKLEVTLTPEQSYGQRREGALQRIPIKHLQGAKVWKPGMTAVVESNQGREQVTIVKVGRFNADCDLNHPLAGKTLTFAIEVVTLREATAEEVTHGHVHTKGGCGH
ncbi:peptidylprolyl isomerase [Psychromonas sp. MB-3u-54]|uniref:FKBP-type peptidyl-prolyl cis-trans isomerase n=1 Tax=Psychromonas sp. MB-3u-54 TaxID=2058319 RepID=UPI000C34B8A6|nr:peptidylprolyl isomerase [Psychromonas sp. MB-3u-54]PKH03267.1 peptidylprolyl isomerase [Psychromonas sp. MB-3u-54]